MERGQEGERQLSIATPKLAFQALVDAIVSGMPGVLRPVLLVSALLTTACGVGVPPACTQLGEAFCTAAGVDCEQAKTLFAQSELSPEQCQKGLDDLKAALPMLTPDMRGTALAVFLREVMRGSPKLDKPQIDRLSRSLGIPVVEDLPDQPGLRPPPDFPPGAELPQNKFSGYLEVPDPPAKGSAPPPPPPAGKVAGDEGR